MILVSCMIGVTIARTSLIDSKPYGAHTQRLFTKGGTLCVIESFSQFLRYACPCL